MTRGRLMVITVAVLALGLPSAISGLAGAHGGASDTGDFLATLPVGETVTEPTVGGLWTCRTDYEANAPGAQTEGPWFNGDGTWDATAKYTVDGDVAWPNASFTISKQGDTRVFTTNDLPTIHNTGVFPVADTDDAAQIDKNPGSIAEQDYTIELDATPEVNAEPSCTGGEIGFLKSGVVLLNAVDAGGRDAVAYEVLDDCDGHPNNAGYHYHSASQCVLAELDSGTGQSKLIGYAFDGFGIYGPRDADGNELTTADLDECHGITSKVKFNGKKQVIYHYVATVDYPYTVGCFRGTNAMSGPLGGGGAGGGPPTGP